MKKYSFIKSFSLYLEYCEEPGEAGGEGLAAEHQGHPHRGEEGKEDVIPVHLKWELNCIYHCKSDICHMPLNQHLAISQEFKLSWIFQKIQMNLFECLKPNRAYQDC